MNPAPATHDLLLHCLREESDASRLEQLTPSDWQNLIEQARNHAVLYLLYHRLKTRNLDHLIPTDTLKAVRTEYFECAWRNNNLYSDLSKILKALQQENIPVIVLKGAYLAKTVYSNIALRPMGDIDILVRKNDLWQVEKKLFELGYTSYGRIRIEENMENQYISRDPGQNSRIDMHWRLEGPNDPFAIAIEKLWQRAQPISIAGTDALALSPEDLLLHLCFHTSYKHLYSNGLRALCDIRESIRHYHDDLDWQIVQSRAEEWGVSNAIYLTLYLAKSLLGAEVPDTVLNKLEPEQEIQQSLAEAEHFLFNPSVDRKLSANHQARKLFGSNALQTAAFFLQRIFLPHETIAQLYNLPVDSPRIPLYYPVRLKDLFVRHTRTVWRIWRKDKATVRQLELVDWLSH